MDQQRRTPRRTLLTALGLGTTGVLGAACAAEDGTPSAGTSTPPTPPRCVLAPEAIEGPYHIDRDLMRSEIAEDRQGVPLTLRLRVVDAGECTPVPRAAVDIWHCDARGYYSGHLELDPDVAPMPDPHVDPTDPSRFLRGTQITDAEGNVEFRTIYPGFYFGRAIHVHVMVHLGGRRVHTGQLYFPEELSARIMRTRHYANRTVRRVTNDADMIFQQQGGKQTTLDVEPRGSDVTAGHIASITMGVRPSETPPPASFDPPESVLPPSR